MNFREKWESSSTAWAAILSSNARSYMRSASFLSTTTVTRALSIKPRPDAQRDFWPKERERERKPFGKGVGKRWSKWEREPRMLMRFHSAFPIWLPAIRPRPPVFYLPTRRLIFTRARALLTGFILIYVYRHGRVSALIAQTAFHTSTHPHRGPIDF